MCCQGECAEEFFLVSGGSPVPTLCGVNNHQHLIYRSSYTIIHSHSSISFIHISYHSPIHIINSLVCNVTTSTSSTSHHSHSLILIHPYHSFFGKQCDHQHIICRSSFTLNHSHSSIQLIHIIHSYNSFSDVQCDPGLRPQPALHHPLRVHCHGPDIQRQALEHQDLPGAHNFREFIEKMHSMFYFLVIIKITFVCSLVVTLITKIFDSFML